MMFGLTFLQTPASLAPQVAPQLAHFKTVPAWGTWGCIENPGIYAPSFHHIFYLKMNFKWL